MCETLDISLVDLLFESKIGVFEQERRVGNSFKVNLTVTIPVSNGMMDDELEGTISYAELYDVVSAQMSREAKTIEYVALSIRRELTERFPSILKGDLSITKITPPISGIIGSAMISITF